MTLPKIKIGKILGNAFKGALSTVPALVIPKVQASISSDPATAVLIALLGAIVGAVVNLLQFLKNRKAED